MRVRNFVLILFLAASTALGQVPSVENLTLVDDSWPLVRAQFDLRAPNGELIAHLDPATVSVVEGANRITPSLSAGYAEGGIAYVFVVDTSGSMQKRLEEVSRGLQELARQMHENDRAAVVSFHDDVSVVTPLTADRAALAGAIDALRAGGRTTQLYYAVHKAVEQFAGFDSARRVLVVVSDGKDEGTAYTLDDSIAAAKKAGANIVSLGVESQDPRYLLNMERMAQQTGGSYIRVANGDDWTAKIEHARLQVQARQFVEWTSTLKKEGFQAATLEIGDGTTITRAAVEVEVPAQPLPKWVPWTAGAGALVVILAIAGLVATMRKRRRRETEARQNELETERRQRDEAVEAHARELEQMKAKLEILEKPQTIESPLPPSAPPPPSPSARRKTVFVPGGPTQNYLHGSLELLDGTRSGAVLPLLDLTSLGRDDDNNVIVEDGRASLHHARIVKEGGAFWLEDLASTNGTFVGERQVTARYPLENGDIVRIGQTRLRFVAK